MGQFLARVAPRSEFSQTVFPPPSKFDPERDIPDLTGKVIIVTGGSSGLGYHTIRHLLSKNAKVYLAARSRSKSEAAIASLKRDTGKSAIFLSIDMEDLNSVKRAAQEFLSKEHKLDVLFNNAGVMTPPNEQLSIQGYDIQFAVNTLAPYYFTKLVLPALERSTAENSVKARVVNTTSSAHAAAPDKGIDWRVLKGGPERDSMIQKWGTSSLPGQGATWKLYGISKMGIIYITHMLNRNYGDKVAAYSVHPGVFKTECQRHVKGLQSWIISLGLKPAPLGAVTQLYAGTMQGAENSADAYFVPWGRVGYPDPRSDNPELEEALREYMEKQVKPFEA